jgi:hypothetical protein
MIGYILTIDQKSIVQGEFYTDSQFFNCVIDINGVWFLFLSVQDKEIIVNNPKWNWLFDLPQGEYIPKPNPPFPI